MESNFSKASSFLGLASFLVVFVTTVSVVIFFLDCLSSQFRNKKRNTKANLYAYQ
ncbi:hypothetical protein JCM19274_2494 [Algibacter lectus]|uniref:Uncharacterized protein n=1 Tax=Algibacter lectus TaxID=221126 RepID=A0A090X5N1_9FLAO|nr:hypothetical protein JCM19274_2494 [Algibacter lectus]